MSLIEILVGIVTETWRLLKEMAPYLLFGFLIAGILNLLIPREKVYKHLSGQRISSVIKSALFGIPLPLCSCGVIPVAAYLRKEGASKGSTVSFLASTPTTGVDSILATYSLMGPLFAIIRPIAALVAGIFGGVFTNLADRSLEKKSMPSQEFSCNLCSNPTPHSHSFSRRIRYVIHYAFFDLVEDVGKWLFIGLLLGGVISFLVPGNLVEQYLGRPIIAYPLMLLIAIPLYVCATGSIPIASSLVLKGMSPGAGLIFLIAGPATNTATLSFVGGKLGKKTLFVYLSVIIITALLFGLLLDTLWLGSEQGMRMPMGGMTMLPNWLKNITSAILVALLLFALIKNISFPYKGRKATSMGKIYKIPDMNCKHCVNAIEKAVNTVPGVKKINISLSDKTVNVEGEFDNELLMKKIQEVGYDVESFRPSRFSKP